MKKKQRRSMLGWVIISNLRIPLSKSGLVFRAVAIGSLMVSLLLGGIREKAENVIYKEFGNTSEVNFRKFELTHTLKDSIQKVSKQRFYSDFVYTWVISKNDSVYGFALLDNVKGKSMPITFMVLYDSDGFLERAVIIKYREPIGGEVGSKVWLKQFLGKSSASVFNDIDGISGATISVNSVSKGIHKLTLLLKAIKKDLI